MNGNSTDLEQVFHTHQTIVKSRAPFFSRVRNHFMDIYYFYLAPIILCFKRYAHFVLFRFFFV